MKSSALIFIIALLFSVIAFGQKSGAVQLQKKDSITSFAKEDSIDPLSPARAAFYSAVLPGLGQAYNKKYWKIPIVYAGMGTGLFFYYRNNKQYNRYRDAYKNRLAGKPDEFTDANGEQLLSDESLIDAQKFYSKNKEISLLVTIGFYILNIVDANVDAHLMQFNVDENLTLRPNLYQNDFNNKTNLGLSLNYKF